VAETPVSHCVLASKAARLRGCESLKAAQTEKAVDDVMRSRIMEGSKKAE
jgi:hypothetical protein